MLTKAPFTVTVFLQSWHTSDDLRFFYFDILKSVCMKHGVTYGCFPESEVLRQISMQDFNLSTRRSSGVDDFFSVEFCDSFSIFTQKRRPASIKKDTPQQRLFYLSHDVTESK